MANLTHAEVVRLVRQPSVWVSPTSFRVGAAQLSQLPADSMRVTLTREYTQDIVAAAGSDAATPVAVAYDENVVADIADTPYRPGTPIIYDFNVIACAYAMPKTFDDLTTHGLPGDGIEPVPFEDAAMLTTVRGEFERQYMVGAGGLETVGLLDPAFLKQVISTGADALASLDGAIELIRCGDGVSHADVIFCNQRARREILRLIRLAGGTPQQIWMPTLGRNVLAYPGPQGYVPVIVNNNIPQDVVGGTESTLLIVQLTGPNAVHIGVPAARNNARFVRFGIDRRPETYTMCLFEFDIMAIDDGTCVALDTFPAPV